MPDQSVLVRGPRVAIRHISFEDREEIAALDRESAALHRPWVPARETTPDAFREYVARFDRPTHEGFVVCLLAGGAIVGGININNIVRGGIQSGALGYVAYASTTGHGYMTEGLRLVVEYAFTALGLHRLEANIQPGNTASVKLVERLGFRREGYSPSFQYVDGAWRDHERWAITAEMTGHAAADGSA
ncbi:GNAT family N-acetyltransferase [Streptomyces rimosus]|uniref:GNAT family N-acetyltransferase n=1 Tax=Streptomyces rimosus TaxID=1927 RepID=UPI000519C382|nr:GNAT family protein [Streptomyces rimosus]